MTELPNPLAPMPLADTKLRRPPLPAPARLVLRARLLQELTAGLSQRLTLVSASAGYGKTTVINQWLDSVDRPYAWLSLDQYDSDLATFLAYLIAAVRSMYPDAMRASELLLRAPALPSPSRLADSLLCDLDLLPGSLILVLDDYHTIQTPEIHALAARLVENMPAHVHLVLVTRADPFLPLDRLRGRQQLAEIRSSALRFTPEEAGQLLQQVLGTTATDETVGLLEESTEGWAVGLQLAAISLRRHGDPAAFARRISQNSQQSITDYLLAEVLEGLPEAERACLLETSAFDRFCAPLCDVIKGGAARGPAGADFLRAIRRANLFLVPLDEEGTWFRYHHLFQYLLQARLRQIYSDVEIKKIHARASAWFAAEGLLDEAIVHAVKAGDMIRAATLVEDHMYTAWNREDWRQLERWLRLLPAAALRRPCLLIAQARLHFLRYQFAAIAALLDTAEGAMSSEPATDEEVDMLLRGEISTLRAAIAHSEGDAESAVRLAEAAMQYLRPDMLYSRGLANLYYIWGLQATGRYATAVNYAHGQLEAHSWQANALTLRLHLGLANVHYEMANLPAMQEASVVFHEQASQAGLGLSLGWSHYVQGWLHYQRNELTDAERCFRHVVEMAYAAHGRAVTDAYTGLVLTALAQERPAEALAAISSLRQEQLERGILAPGAVAESLRQRVSLAGDPASALDWRYDRQSGRVSSDLWEQPALTQVRTLLWRGSPEDLAQGAELLAESRAKALARHSNRQLIEVGALEALVLSAQGNERAALAALQEAVEHGAPGGALRLLVDCGPGLIGLLTRLQAAGVAPAYIRQVLAAFDSAAATSTAPASDGDSTRPAMGQDMPAAALTNREIDVLMLLAQRLPDKEIAQRLVLSPDTVKKHTQHIYHKLGVHNRRAAVAQARCLGLI